MEGHPPIVEPGVAPPWSAGPTTRAAVAVEDRWSDPHDDGWAAQDVGPWPRQRHRRSTRVVGALVVVALVLATAGGAVVDFLDGSTGPAYPASIQSLDVGPTSVRVVVLAINDSGEATRLTCRLMVGGPDGEVAPVSLHPLAVVVPGDQEQFTTTVPLPAPSNGGGDASGSAPPATSVTCGPAS